MDRLTRDATALVNYEMCYNNTRYCRLSMHATLYMDDNERFDFMNRVIDASFARCGHSSYRNDAIIKALAFADEYAETLTTHVDVYLRFFEDFGMFNTSPK